MAAQNLARAVYGHEEAYASSQGEGLMTMQSRHIAKLIKWGGLVTVAIAVWLPATFSQAGEITQKGRDVYVCTDEKYVEIGDVPDHWVGVFDCEGISSTEGVEAGIFEFRGIDDYIAGMGPEQGYYAVTYDDGSFTRFKPQPAFGQQP